MVSFCRNFKFIKIIYSRVLISYTITFALFKGFPWKKVPFFVASQIFGAFIATLAVYGAYKTQLDAVAAALTAAGEGAVIFSPLGPAGAMVLYPGIGQQMKYICEFKASSLLTCSN